MNPDQIALVQGSWRKVVPISEKAADIFYSRLFEIDPSARSLFKGDMKEQGRRLMEMITTAVEGLNNLEAIVPAVQDLGRRHAGYGVKVPHYESVASALLWTLRQGLGGEFTADVKDAWVETYQTLAGVMQAAAAEPRQQPTKKPVKSPAKNSSQAAAKKLAATKAPTAAKAPTAKAKKDTKPSAKAKSKAA